jgi:hypothetical protein
MVVGILPWTAAFVHVEAVNKGMAVSEMASAFGVDRTMLHRWLARYERDGEAGLRRRPVTGRPRVLPGIIPKRLQQIVLTPASKFGFATVFGPWADRTPCWSAITTSTSWKTPCGSGCGKQDLRGKHPKRQGFEADPETCRRWQEETIPQIDEAAGKHRRNPVSRG